MTGLNVYLRRKSGLDPRLVELAILVTARELDSEYVWTAHEPAAQKAGLAQEIIDTVKYRRPSTTLGEKEAVVVQLGRDSISKHKVSSDTFARAVKLFGHQGVVNIVALIGDYAATAILLNVSDQHVRRRQVAAADPVNRADRSGRYDDSDFHFGVVDVVIREGRCRHDDIAGNQFLGLDEWAVVNADAVA